MARLRTVFRTDNALTLPDQRHRFGRDGGVLRQPARAGRHRDRRRQRRVRRAHVRGRAPVRRRGRPRRGATWGRPLDPQRLLDAQREHPDARLVAVVHAETSTGVENDIAPLAALAATPTRCCSSTPSRRSAASRSRSTRGASTPATRARRSASACRPGLSPVTFSAAGGRPRRRPRALPPQSWYLDLSLIANYVGGAAACTTTPRRSR